MMIQPTIMHVRRLVGTKGLLIDPQMTPPPNIAFYNPSATNDYLCIRVSEFSPTEDRSDMMICDLRTNQSKRIPSPYHMLCPTMNIYKGLEDMRIVSFQGRVWFTASCTHASSEMLNELVVGYFDETVSQVAFCQRVKIGTPPIKNIVPVVWKEQLWVMDVLKCKMFLLRQDPNTKTMYVEQERVLKCPIQHTYGPLRGSTNPIHLHGNTWGCVVHSVLFNNTPVKDIQLAYMHHWMELDLERGCITYISTPFWCMHWGVEFVSGLTKEYDAKTKEEKICLYLGVRDKQPAKIETTLADLRVSKDG